MALIVELENSPNLKLIQFKCECKGNEKKQRVTEKPNARDFAMSQCHRVCAFLLIVLICNANRQFAVCVLAGIGSKNLLQTAHGTLQVPEMNAHMQTHAHTHTHGNRMNIAHKEEHSNIMPKTMSVWNTTILWLTDFIFLFLSLPLSLSFARSRSLSSSLSALSRFQFSWFRFTRARHVSRMDCVKIVGSHAQKILNCKVNESKEMYNFQSAAQCF